MASTINALTSGGGVAIAGDTSGQLQLQTNNGVTAVTVDASQNVGIGTSSPSNKLTISTNANSQQWTQILNTNAGSSATGGLLFGNDGSGAQATMFVGSSAYSSYGGASSLNLGTFGGGPVTFLTSATERMRIDSSGNLLINNTSSSTINTGILVNKDPGEIIIGHPSGTVSTWGYMGFRYANTTIGSVTQVGTTAVLYNTTSDYRLKTDVEPIKNALTTIEALNPVTFTWVDGRKDDGFIAHEIQSVIPNCVTGEKDAINEDGTPKYQQLDNSGVIPFLVKAIQELKAEVDAQAEEIKALKGVA
jgi:Chaperone of endosialidase